MDSKQCFSASHPTVPPRATHCMSWDMFWDSGTNICAWTGTGSLKFSGSIFSAVPARTLLLWQLTPPLACLMTSPVSCTTHWNSTASLDQPSRSCRTPLVPLCAPRSDKGMLSVRWTSSEQTCSTTALVSPSVLHALCVCACVCVCACALLDYVATAVCVGELERPLKDDCQLQREANPPSFILTGADSSWCKHTLSHAMHCLSQHADEFCASSTSFTGDTVTFSGVTSSQRNMSLHCSATNCSLQPSSNNSSPIQLSIQTVYMSYRLRIHSEVLIVVGNNESWLDCSGPVCALTDCPQQGERKVNGRCLRHLLTIHFNDSKVGEGEQEGLKDGSAVSLAPAFKGTANRTCSNCPASPDTRGLKSLIVHKIY